MSAKKVKFWNILFLFSVALYQAGGRSAKVVDVSVAPEPEQYFWTVAAVDAEKKYCLFDTREKPLTYVKRRHVPRHIVNF